MNNKHKVLKRTELIAIATVVPMFLASCETSPGEVEVPEFSDTPSIQAQGEQRFYFYQGSPVDLKIDARRLVVTSTLPSASDVVDALGTVGLPVDSVVQLSLVGGDHKLVWLRSGAPERTVREAIPLLRSTQRFQFVSNAYRTVDGDHEVLLLNRLVVRFKDDVTPRQIDSLNAAFGTRILRPPRPDSGFAEYWLEYPPDGDPLQIAAMLYQHALVNWADPDNISDRRPHTTPTDPYFNLQYYLKSNVYRSGIRIDINVEAAWDITTGDQTVHVAVIDDGVDFQQQDIQFFGGEMGYDLLWQLAEPGESAFSPYNDDTHGTAVAGIIKARHNNGLGIAGVAPNVRLYPIRIFRRTYDPCAPGCTQRATNAQIGDAINWAWQFAEADVINNSWGGGAPSDHITNAIHNAVTQGRNGKGSVVIFSAGNGGGPVNYPAYLDDVIAVGALAQDGELASYSNFGPALDIVAFGGERVPFTCSGADIVTTDAWSGDGCNDGPGGDVNFTATFSGTSAAAPQVSGVAALLLSSEPGLTWTSVRNRILSSADNWGSSYYFGNGKLDAYGTLVSLPLSASINGPSEVLPMQFCSWQASVSGGLPPYTYSWSGVLSGSGSSVMGLVSESGWLNLTVTDAANSQFNTAKFITVDFQAPECF